MDCEDLNDPVRRAAVSPGDAPILSSGLSSSDRSRGARRRQNLRPLPPGVSSHLKINEVPSQEPPVLSKPHFEVYMDTDPESRTRSSASVKTPSGPWQDIATSPTILA
jgi:hypothetical protein